ARRRRERPGARRDLRSATPLGRCFKGSSGLLPDLTLAGKSARVGDASAPKLRRLSGLYALVAVGTAEPDRSRARARAAPTNSRKSGAGRVGRDLNSGWN